MSTPSLEHTPVCFDTPCSKCGSHATCLHRTFSPELFRKIEASRPLCINCKWLGSGDPEQASCDHPNNLRITRSVVTGELLYHYSDERLARVQRMHYVESCCGVDGRWFEAAKVKEKIALYRKSTYQIWIDFWSKFVGK